MPDEGAVRRIGAYFSQKAQENLQRRAECVKQVNTLLMPNRITRIKDGVASIDVVKDVIDATCIRWICETLVSRCCFFLGH